MKKISTLLFSSLFSLTLLAFDGSRLSISTVKNNMDLKIEVDGRRFNMQNNSITLSNLKEGYHTVKIIREKRRSENNYGDNNNYGNGNVNAYGFGRRGEIIYNTSVFLRRGFALDIIVSPYGKVFTDENPIDQNEDFYNDDNRYNDNDGRWNNSYINVMNAREFDQFKESLRKEWFENSRIISAKVIIDKNNFTAQQAKDMALLFDFENSKLEIAKYAYRKTIDKQNYYLVNDVFTFSNSKEELARFIREAR
ncbi:MAG: DUF4476 domain-containing protein [Chitinophagaceae bacterium]